jgi:hypothetical protein
VGARRLRVFQATLAYHRLQVVLVRLLSVHWLVVTFILISGVHARSGAWIQLPEGLAVSLVLWSGLFYIMALPLMAPILAWIWVRQVKAVPVSRRVARWALPIALVSYSLHVLYYVPFMTVID